MSIIKRTRIAASLAVAGLAVAGTMAVAMPAGAATVSGSSQRAAVSHVATPQTITPHTYSCDSVGSNSYAWWGNCHVYSGQARAAAACGDGTVHYGAWVGVGYWQFGMDCSPYSLNSYWVESTG